MAHCWKGNYELLEEQTGAAWWLATELGDDLPASTCMLEDGHDGPHEFTDDDGIVLNFAAVKQ